MDNHTIVNHPGFLPTSITKQHKTPAPCRSQEYRRFHLPLKNQNALDLWSAEHARQRVDLRLINSSTLPPNLVVLILHPLPGSFSQKEQIKNTYHRLCTLQIPLISRSIVVYPLMTCGFTSSVFVTFGEYLDRALSRTETGQKQRCFVANFAPQRAFFSRIPHIARICNKCGGTVSTGDASCGNYGMLASQLALELAALCMNTTWNHMNFVMLMFASWDESPGFSLSSSSWVVVLTLKTNMTLPIRRLAPIISAVSFLLGIQGCSTRP